MDLHLIMSYQYQSRVFSIPIIYFVTVQPITYCLIDSTHEKRKIVHKLAERFLWHLQRVGVGSGRREEPFVSYAFPGKGYLSAPGEQRTPRFGFQKSPCSQNRFAR